MPRVKLFDEQTVLEAATDLFWEKGYHATSIQDLVSHLGINRASLYGTFGGKKELFYKAFEHYRTINIQRVKDFLNAQKTIKAGFRKLFKSSIDHAIADPDHKGCFVVNTTTELIPGDPEMKAMLQKHERAFEKIFHEFLKKGETSGEIPKGKNLKAIAHLLFTLNNGMQVVTKMHQTPKKMMASVDEVLILLD